MRSPSTPSGSRLVASSAKFGQPRSSASASFAQAPMTCSQLSSRSSRPRPPTAPTSVSSTGRPGSWRTPSTSATVTATRSGSPSGARSANHTPSPAPSASPAATCSPSRVLPAPPAPVNVTSRDPLTNARTAASSPSRPMKLDTCAGRLLRSLGSSSDSNGRKAAGKPSARSWKICSGRLTSFSRCRPRSASHTPSGSAPTSSRAAAADTTTWPPCAAAIRLASCTSSPAAVWEASPQWIPIRTRTRSPAGHACDTSARCIWITASTHARGEANTAKIPSPWVTTSSPPCAVTPARISR